MIAFVANVDGSVRPLEQRRPTLEELQALVGGYIEVLALRRKGRIIGQMIINDDGKRELPHNPAATFLAHCNDAMDPSDWIAGPAVVLAGEAMIE